MFFYLNFILLNALIKTMLVISNLEVSLHVRFRGAIY
jgi:hypothetical protein